MRHTIRALLAVLLFAAPASAAQAPFEGTYQVLSATMNEQLHSGAPGIGESCPTTSGTNVYSATIGQQPADGSSSVESFDGKSTGRLTATGNGSLTSTIHGCDITAFPPVPCTDSGSGAAGAGFSFDLEAADGATEVTVQTYIPWIAFAHVGTNMACQALLRAPFGGPVAPDVIRVPVDTFLSDEPQTITIRGQQTSSPGGGFSGGADYTISVTFRRIGGDLFITTSPATNVDVSGSNWPFGFVTKWGDDGCGTPPPNSPRPLAYAVVGADRTALRTLLSASQEGLAGRPGFAAGAFRLRGAGRTMQVSARARNERGAGFLAAASALHVRNGGAMRPGDGLFYGGRIACRSGGAQTPYKKAKADPRVLCRNRPTLPGRAWSKLTTIMKAKLGELFAALRAGDICFALSSGYRSVQEQRDLYEDWHEVADRPDPADRTRETLNQLCPGGSTAGGPLAGFIQCPTGWHPNGKAKNGPARPGSSRHNAGEAADLRLAFGARTGKFDPSPAQRKQDILAHFNEYVAKVPGLCASPAEDPGHVELPYAADGEPARCHFTSEPSRAPASAGAAARAKLAAAASVANSVARRFVERSFTDEYVDWQVGRCRGGRRKARCRLSILGSGTRPYTCRTEVLVKKKRGRSAGFVQGRKTRCR